MMRGLFLEGDSIQLIDIFYLICPRRPALPPAEREKAGFAPSPSKLSPLLCISLYFPDCVLSICSVINTCKWNEIKHNV